MGRSFDGKRVAIVGMGKSNQALCRYLLKEGAEITCFDRKTKEELGHVYDEFSSYGVKWSLGSDYLDILPSFKHIFLTPGMKKNQPEIVEARNRGAVISTEVALFLERCKARVCGVTGSAGKTTTTTLVAMMLKESLPHKKIFVGGNIGSVLIEKVDEIPEDALVVLELSSFQLELVEKDPDVSVILNVKPNHLDIHDSFEDYVNAKRRIYRFQNKDNWCILNFDDPITRKMLSECPGNVGLFSLRPFDRDIAKSVGQIGKLAYAWLEQSTLFAQVENYPVQRIASAGDLLVPGAHNISNTLAAILLSMLMGANPEGILTAIKSFGGVEHRIEFVREAYGVKYYNDSIATSPDRTIALLETLRGPLVLILGGYDKGLPFDELAEKVVARNCIVITMGKTAGKIESAIVEAWERTKRSGCPDISRVSSLEEAVHTAKQKAKPGYSVVLSPACASFDMFRNFEERGRLFKEIVRKL